MKSLSEAEAEHPWAATRMQAAQRGRIARRKFENDYSAELAARKKKQETGAGELLRIISGQQEQIARLQASTNAEGSDTGGAAVVGSFGIERTFNPLNRVVGCVTVDCDHIESDGGRGKLRMSAKPPSGGGDQSALLVHGDRRRCAAIGVVCALSDLDHDHGCTVTHDQVDLA